MGLPFELSQQARIPIKLDELLRAHAEVFVLDDEDLPLVRSELKGIVKDRHSIITAARGDELMGYCIATPLREYRDEPLINAFSIYPLDETIYIRYVGSKPEFRGRGIASQLIAQAFAQARMRGFRFGAGHFRDGPSQRAAMRAFGENLEISEPLNYGKSNGLFHYMAGRV